MSSNNSIAITIKALNLKKQQHEILRTINNEFFYASFLGLLGPNGSGKSSLLRCIAGIESHYNGTIECYNLPQKHGQVRIGFLPPENQHTFEYSVLETVLMGKQMEQAWLPINMDQQLKDVEELLAIFEIEDLLAKPLFRLSSGERKRVYLARTFYHDADIILLDEPFNFLDLYHRQKLARFFYDQCQNRHKLIISVFHDLGLAYKYCHKLLLLDKGAPYAFGPPESVLSDSNIQAVYHIDPKVVHTPFTFATK